MNNKMNKKEFINVVAEMVKSCPQAKNANALIYADRNEKNESNGITLEFPDDGFSMFLSLDDPYEDYESGNMNLMEFIEQVINEVIPEALKHAYKDRLKQQQDKAKPSCCKEDKPTKNVEELINLIKEMPDELLTGILSILAEASRPEERQENNKKEDDDRAQQREFILQDVMLTIVPDNEDIKQQKFLYEKILGMNVAYYVSVSVDETKKTLKLLRPIVLSELDISRDVLFDAALKNTMKEFPAVTCTPQGFTNLSGFSKISDDIAILTTTDRSNGAISVLYPNTVKEIAKKLNDDLYLMPIDKEAVMAFRQSKMPLEKLKLYMAVQKQTFNNAYAEGIICFNRSTGMMTLDI